MRVLVACEFSGVVMRAFRKRGHDAWAYDALEPVADYHMQRDLSSRATGHAWFEHKHWDLMIAFPPCTHLAVSGARWFKDKRKEQAEAIEFVLHLANALVPRIAIENPIGVLSTKWRKPDQIIQPWQFGHGETKATCLWLKNLPKLVPTDVVEGREQRIWKMAPSPDRWKRRSVTYQGIADAMAEQWGE
jgi:site-specific DNA-cytosine methylase